MNEKIKHTHTRAQTYTYIYVNIYIYIYIWRECIVGVFESGYLQCPPSIYRWRGSLIFMLPWQHPCRAVFSQQDKQNCWETGRSCSASCCFESFQLQWGLSIQCQFWTILVCDQEGANIQQLIQAVVRRRQVQAANSIPISTAHPAALTRSGNIWKPQWFSHATTLHPPPATSRSPQTQATPRPLLKQRRERNWLWSCQWPFEGCGGAGDHWWPNDSKSPGLGP